MKYARELLMVLLMGAVLRFAPVLFYGVPLSYDAPFHLTRAWETIYSGSLNRAEFYPPLYRLLLAGIQMATGFDLVWVGAVLLPLFSTLTVLSVFAFVRALAGPRMALLASLLIAWGAPLLAAAYDSPENIVLFLLPAGFLLYRHDRKALAPLVIASAILWNQLAALVVVASFTAAYYRHWRSMRHFAVAALAFLGVYLFSVDWKLVAEQSISAGMAFIQFNLREALPVMALASLAFAVPLLYACQAKRAIAGWTRFWFYWFTLSTLGVASYAASTFLRPWEHVKFLFYSGAVLLSLVRGEQKFRAFAYILTAFLFLSAVIVSFQLVYPKMQQHDFPAIEFLEFRARQNQGLILAEPSLSQWIAFATGLDDRLLTSLHFEAAKTGSRFQEGLGFLQSQGTGSERSLQELGVKYVVLNFEDERLRGVNGIESKPYLNKVYSVEYFSGCPFGFLPRLWGLACGWNQAEVLETRE